MAIEWDDRGLHELQLSKEFWDFHCVPILGMINREFSRDFDSEHFKDYEKHTFFPRLFKSYDLRHLGNKVVQKFRYPNHRARSTQVALRFPGNEMAPWHIDGVNVEGNMVNPDHPFHFEATVGLYLSDVDKDSSPLQVKLGSHRVVERFGEEKGYSILAQGVLPPSIHDMNTKAVTGLKGKAFMMHPHLVHSVPINTSPNIRYALYWRIFE